jgi:vancomycin resistance protein YoaR
MQLSKSTVTLPNKLLIILYRLLLVLIGGFTAILVGVLLFTFGVRGFYANKALPGVQAGGLDLTGLSQPEIELALGDLLQYPWQGRIVLTDRERQWIARPEEVGVVIDIPSMATQALSVGRAGNLFERLGEQWEAWRIGYSVPTIVLLDQRIGGAYLDQLGQELYQPVQEATLDLEDLRIVYQPGQIGRELDIDTTLAEVAVAASRLVDTEIALPIRQTHPLVLEAQAEAAIAREILSESLNLTVDDAGPWTLSREELAEMLRFQPVEDQQGGRIQIELDPNALYSILEPLSEELERSPRNARFIFNDDTRELDLLEEAIIGRTLNIPASIMDINQRILDGQHQIALTFALEDPEVGSQATADDLGISEAVSVVSTYFAGSSFPRIQNIRTASSAFHGLLLAPGETLSMAEALGEISLDTGYAEALIIFGNRTIKGVGGGVCQVSTTLFRTAFMGGFEIVERHPHAYRVGYYEQGPGSPGPGFDATVFVPLVDFKFRNDSPYWLLLETYVYNTQLLWKFYSTSDGRTVQWTSSGPQNVVEAPEPLYKENPDLEEGEIEQVDYEADGMDILVTRTVTQDGVILHEDIIKTHYLPWRAIYEFGPGTELPDDVEIEED